MNTNLGFGSVLDPYGIRISRHALDRYCERRGWAKNGTQREIADACIRELLTRCVSQRPPAAMIGGHNTTTRRYKVGNLAFITSADHSVLITVYLLEQNAKKRDRKRRKAVK